MQQVSRWGWRGARIFLALTAKNKQYMYNMLALHYREQGRLRRVG